MNLYRYTGTRGAIPVETAGYVLDKAAKDYDTNLEKYNTLNLLASSLRGSEDDNKYIEATIDKISHGLDSMADGIINTNGDKNIAFEKSFGLVNKLSNDFLTDRKIQDIQASNKNYEKEQAMIQEYMSKGEVPLVFSDYSKHRTVNPDGTTNIYRSHVEPRGDYTTSMQNIWKLVKPDGFDTPLTQSELEDYYQRKTVRGLSPDKIDEKLSEAVRTYTDTAAGQQDLKRLTNIGYEDNTPLGKEEAIKNITNRMRSIGMLGTFREEGTSYQVNQDALREKEHQRNLAEIEARERYKAEYKKAEGNPYAGSDSSRYLSYTPGYGSTTEQGFEARITDPDVMKTMNDLYNGDKLPVSEQAIHVIGGTEKGIKPIDIAGKITKFTPRAFNAKDATGNDKFVGGIIGKAEYGDGKSVDIVVEASPQHKQAFLTLTRLARAGQKIKDSDKIKVGDTAEQYRHIPDETGLIASQFTYPDGRSANVQFQPVKTANGVEYRLTWQKKNGFVRMTQEDIDDFAEDAGINVFAKPVYSLAELERMTMQYATGSIPEIRNAIESAKTKSESFGANTLNNE